MKHWLRRVRGAVMVGITWFLVWAIIGGGVMEAIVDPDGRIADIWPMVLGIPGFFGGIIFAVVLSIAERQRRFEELSVGRFAALGAVAGALLGIPAMVVFGNSALILVPLTLLGTISASGSLALAKRGTSREQLVAGDDETMTR